MPEEMSAAADQAPANQGEPASNTTGDAADPAYVTQEALTDLLSKITSDIKSDLGRQIKALQQKATSEGEGKPATQDKPKAAEKSSSSSSTEQTLRERLARLEENEAKQHKKAMRVGLRDALVRAGADPTLAELSVPALIEMEGANLSVNETSFGDLAVSYQGDGVDAWAKVFMEGDMGKRLLSPTSAPKLNLPGENSQGTPVREVPFSQARSVSDEDLRSGRVRLVNG